MDVKIKSCAAVLVTFGLISLASAMEPGFYLGGAVGATNFQNNDRTIATGSTPATINVSPSNTGLGERFYMGVNISPYWAIEGGYTHYAPSSYKVPESVACNDPTINVNGVDLAAKGMLPLSRFTAFAKAGLTLLRQTQSGSLSDSEAVVSPCASAASSGSTTSTRPLVGAGVSVDLTQNWAAELFATHAFGGGNIKSVDFMGVGISYHFNDKYCGQFLC